MVLTARAAAASAAAAGRGGGDAAAGASSFSSRASVASAASASPSAACGGSEDYGQGWQQLTDHGKIYLSKKEKNVFILEGTKTAGYSACAFRGTEEQCASVDAGAFCLTVELKTVPGETCPDQHVYVVLDCYGMTDLSSGCDFCGIKLCFDSRELRVESHRRNATVQTLYAQPGCALLRPLTYATLAITLSEGALSLAISGVSVVSNLPLSRVRGATAPRLGVAVYGKTRCYLRRFRVSEPGSIPGAGEEPALSPAAGAASSSPATARRLSASLPRRGTAEALGAGAGAGGAAPPPALGGGPGQVSGAAALGGGAAFASEEFELAATIERDIVVQDLSVKFEDIGGLDDAKRAINEAVVLPLILPEFFTGIRKPWKGVLLFGPPGTGKTMLAKAAAACTDNITFFNCSSATLTSKWRGESEKLLRALFQTARAKVPSILFFDEVDSLLSQRGTSAEHEASRRFKSEFLIHMDGLLSDSRPDGAGEPAGHLLVLCTSNAPWDLDEALRRRLEKRIYIPLPDAEARLRMFKSNLKDIVVAEDVDLPSLAARTEGYSGADVQLVCRDASMNPMRRLIEGLSPADLVRLRDEGKLQAGSAAVEMSDFEAALSSVQPSVAIGDTQRYLDWARDFGSK